MMLGNDPQQIRISVP